MDGDALEPGWLLEPVADAQLCPLRDGEIRDVTPIVKDLPLRGLHQTHDDLGQRGFAAAVGSGKHHQPMVGDGDGNILENVHLSLWRGHVI